MAGANNRLKIGCWFLKIIIILKYVLLVNNVTENMSLDDLMWILSYIIKTKGTIGL